jgi:hypothetical protein
VQKSLIRKQKLLPPGSAKLCRDPGSNQGPLDLQSNALPTELSRLISLTDMHYITFFVIRKRPLKHVPIGFYDWNLTCHLKVLSIEMEMRK